MKKMFIVSMIVSLSVLFFCSCSKQTEPTPSKPPAQSGSITETEKNTETEAATKDITDAILTGNINIKGVYYETDDKGEFKTDSGGNPKEYYKEFTGSFSNIKDIILDEDNNTGDIIVFFTANIENEYYKITEPQGIQAFLKRNSDNSISFVSSNIAEDMPAFIVPIFEFNRTYILQKQYEITFSLPADQYTDNYIYAGFDIQKSDLHGKDTGGVYLFTFVLSEDTVEQIEIIPGNKNTPFRISSPKIVLTLKNGISISTKSDIYFNVNQNNENIKGADFWNVEFSDSYYSWGLES